MAALTPHNMTGYGSEIPTFATASASDTVTKDSSYQQVFVIKNDSGGALTPNLVGDEAAAGTSVSGANGALGTIDASAGYEMSEIADGADAVFVPFDNIKGWLAGSTVTVTGADGAKIAVLNFPR